MNEHNPVSPQRIVASLPTGSTTINGNGWQDCLRELNVLLKKLGYHPVSFMQLKRTPNVPTPTTHNVCRAERPRGRSGELVEKKIYCTRCSTHCSVSYSSHGNTFRFGVVGLCTLQKQGDDGNNWQLQLTQLYPHYTKCTELTNSTIIDNHHNCFKITVPDADFLINGLFDELLQQVNTKTLAQIHNPSNNIAKLIRSGLIGKEPIDLRYQIPLLPSTVEEDQHGNSIRENLGIENQIFQDDFINFVIRFSLLIANTMGIGNQMFFQVPTHPHDTIINNSTRHLHMVNPSILLGGYMSRRTTLITPQMPHTDTGVNSQLESVLENRALQNLCFPFSVIMPLVAESSRRIMLYDAVHEDIAPTELTINHGEICVIPANAVHGGTTQAYVPHGRRPDLFPALQMYVQSTRHDFDPHSFVASVGHAIKNEAFNDYIEKMPNNHLNEVLETGIAPVLTLLSKLHKNEEFSVNCRNKRNEEVLKDLFKKMKPTKRNKRGK